MTNEFEGVKLVRASIKTVPQARYFSLYPAADQKRSCRLTFHRQYHGMITKSYLDYVLKKKAAVGIRKRQRKLYTNNPTESYTYKRNNWSHVVFEHPATFQTLAMTRRRRK